jgi:hypothetical protein
MNDPPLSIIMTPMQENQAMQDYVRQMMARGVVPPPTLPGSAQSPPPAPPEEAIPGSYGVGMAPQLDVSRPGGGPPGLDFRVDLAGNNLRNLPQGRAAIPDIMYRRNFQF